MRAMHTPGRLLVIPAVLLTFAACANGTDDLLPGYYEEQAGGGGLGGDGGAGGGDLSASSSSSVSVGSTGVGGAEGEGGDGGSNEGDEAAGGDGGAAAECDHAAPNTCTGAEELDPISGDVEADSMTVTGTTSKWFKILIVDDADEASAEHFRATLDSPPGMNFDLIVYQGGIAVDAPDCFVSGVRGQGVPESFYVTWNDRFIDPDDRWFVIEVRYVEGTACGEDAKWTLTILGNNAALTSP